MARGSTHTLATLMVGAAGVSQLPLPDAIAWGLGAVYATVVQPDLDQCEGAFGYYGFFVMRETYPALEFVWKWYWSLYAKLFSHRSFFSHAPFVGTLLRLIYFAPYILFTYRYFPQSASYFLTVIIAADTLHWIMDWRIWGAFRFFRQ